MGTVSICMATFNGEKYIKEQLDSILSQLGPDDELIISDDSSTDNTLAIVESYRDKRIKIFPDQRFRSPIFNFENALKHATGDCIFLSDQDDIWHPDKIKIMLPRIAENHLALCDCSIINNEGQIIKPSYFKMINSQPGFIKNLFKTNPYVGCCMGFSKQLLQFALPFPKGIPMHDLWIGMVAEMQFSPIFVPQSLVYYRRHGANASQTGSVSTNSVIKKLVFRLNILGPLFLRKIKSYNF